MKTFVDIFFIIFFRYSISISSTANEQYVGNQLIKMTPPTNSSLKNLNNFLVQHQYDVWKGTAEPNKPCSVRVTPEEFPSLKEFCEQENIDLTVEIPDLKKMIDDHVNDNGYTESSSSFDYNKYNRYDDILDELRRLRRHYWYNLRIRTIGYSYEGRELQIVKISNNIQRCSQKPIIWIDGGTHGREWISVAAGMFMLKTILEQNGKDPNITRLLRDYEIFFIPVFNPDGYEYTFTDARLWRKTRTDFNGEECIGADPNRNWDVMWGGVGSSSDPCSNIYRGIHAESEPCVKKYAYILNCYRWRIKAYWSLHSFFQLLLLPNFYTRTLPSDSPKHFKIGAIFSSAVRKRFGTSYAFAPSPFLFGAQSGDSVDYVHDKLHITHSYIIELRDRGVFGFLLPTNQIEPTALETLDGIVASVLSIDTL